MILRHGFFCQTYLKHTLEIIPKSNIGLEVISNPFLLNGLLLEPYPAKIDEWSVSREDQSIVDVLELVPRNLALLMDAGGVTLDDMGSEGGSWDVGVVGEGASSGNKNVRLVLPPSARYRNSLTDEKLHFLLGAETKLQNPANPWLGEVGFFPWVQWTHLAANNVHTQNTHTYTFQYISILWKKQRKL